MPQALLELPASGEIDSTHLRKLIIRFDWEEGQTYRLLFPPETLSGWRDAGNDSLTISYRIASKKDFGDIKLQFDSLYTQVPLALDLMQQDRVVDRFIIPEGTEKWEKKLSSLNPGNYQLRIIEDLNGNGRWDPGNYDEKRQPERLQILSLEPLRANWEVEAKLEVSWTEGEEQQANE